MDVFQVLTKSCESLCYCGTADIDLTPLTLRGEERGFRRDVSDSAYYRSSECSCVKVRKCKCDLTYWKGSILPSLSPYPESEEALNMSIIGAAELKHEDVSGAAAGAEFHQLSNRLLYCYNTVWLVFSVRRLGQDKQPTLMAKYEWSKSSVLLLFTMVMTSY